MAKRVRFRPLITTSDSGAQEGQFSVDTGNKTYTEAHHGVFYLVTNTEVNAGIGQLTQGNFLYAKATTGTVLVAVGTITANATNSVKLLTNGFIVVANCTFSKLRFKNTNTGAAGASSTVEYHVYGD